MEMILKTTNLCKSFSGQTVVNNISLNIERNSVYGLLGPNGAGKSTLLNALELGVYNHIAGDGREYVITDATALKLRSEDGRSIKDVDISLFINDLPNKKNTHCFTYFGYYSNYYRNFIFNLFNA